MKFTGEIAITLKRVCKQTLEGPIIYKIYTINIYTIYAIKNLNKN